jgi:hypothetical protein
MKFYRYHQRYTPGYEPDVSGWARAAHKAGVRSQRVKNASRYQTALRFKAQKMADEKWATDNRGKNPDGSFTLEIES